MKPVTIDANISARSDDQLWYYNFRISEYPDVYDNVAFPRNEESQRQFFMQMTLDIGGFDSELVAESMVAVMEKSGDGILITHSAG